MKGQHDVPAPWPGLAYVMEHGLPGFPAPRVEDPPPARAFSAEQVERRRAYFKRWAAKNRPRRIRVEEL